MTSSVRARTKVRNALHQANGHNTERYRRLRSLLSTTTAFRLSPGSFARFIGDFRNAALNCS